MRVLVLALSSVGLIVAGTLVVAWFVARVSGAGIGVDLVTIDLREARACTPDGVCGTFPIDKLRGGSGYPTFALISFWAGLGVAALVLYQAGSRLLAGFASEALSKSGYGLAMLVLLTGVAAGYLFGPDTGTAALGDMALTIERSWGPLALIAGLFVGCGSLYYSALPDSGDEPAAPAALPPARAVAETERARVPSERFAKLASERTSIPIPTMLKGKLQYATLAAELTRAGIDARREDGKTLLVMWSDVVGVVARRLPPELEGAPFVDIVSSAGSTLRMLPWTRLSGDPVEGEGDVRVRALVRLVTARCPDAQLDKATRAYVDGSTDHAPQLPDLATLAAHDERLA